VQEHEIETLAETVLDAYRQEEPPVNLELIAKEERIKLVEGDFPDDFHGQIEYLKEFGTFAIYHPRLATARSRGRVRFSICHEFGHYFIEAHRRVLLSGITHHSEGFRTNSPIEIQADRFASALLLPRKAVDLRLGKHRILTLEKILKLAGDCDASAQAAAFRYVNLAEERCVAVVSRDREILYSFHSPEAKARGFAFLGNKLVPHASAALRAAQVEPGEIVQLKTSSHDWFSARDYTDTDDLWEEAVRVGRSSVVLSLLSWA
jgi:hypothetical protein